MKNIEIGQVISSQLTTVDEIVEQKKAELAGESIVTLPVWEVGVIDGIDEEFFILCDGHHRFEAANQLGIPVVFEVVDHPEDLTGETLLESSMIDTSWYYLDTEIAVF